MPLLHALVLGIVQGLTEFLPISSSGHLRLVPWLFGWEEPVSPSVRLAFDTSLHLGTLVAVLFYLRREVVPYVRHGIGLVVRARGCDRAVGVRAWLLVASAIPAGVAGVAGEDWIGERLGAPAAVAVTLIVFGLVLLVADRASGSRGTDDFGWRDSLVLGLAQVLALNPGTSRSGITITAARLRGMSRDAAARASFLMSIPIIGGAVTFQLASLVRDGVPDGFAGAMAVGIVAAAVSGWAAMAGMIRMLRTRAFTGFVAYRVVLGAGVLLLLATPWWS